MDSQSDSPQKNNGIKDQKSPQKVGVADAIREFLTKNPSANSTEVVNELKKQGITTNTKYVNTVIRRGTGSTDSDSRRRSAQAKYPRHTLEKALRIPKAIIEQNAGKECSEEESATFAGLTFNRGPFTLELSSAIKYGLLERPGPGKIKITELAKKILRPHDSKQELEGLREAALNAPDISNVYKHYRGENLPDEQFFDNALIDKFKIPSDKISDFKSIFHETLTKAKLQEQNKGKIRIIDVSGEANLGKLPNTEIEKTSEIKIKPTDTCFVMMPFAPPLGNYYEKIYEPAINKAGLKPVRADDDIFKTGKIMDQIWYGINSARVLLAELTKRNPNVFYELGLAHALKKPVVLVSSNEEDVPFDLHHIRVIYYDVLDPFWGQKLMEKVAENIISALKNPEEAIFQTANI